MFWPAAAEAKLDGKLLEDGMMMKKMTSLTRDGVVTGVGDEKSNTERGGFEKTGWVLRKSRVGGGWKNVCNSEDGLLKRRGWGKKLLLGMQNGRRGNDL